MTLDDAVHFSFMPLEKNSLEKVKQETTAQTLQEDFVHVYKFVTARIVWDGPNVLWPFVTSNKIMFQLALQAAFSVSQKFVQFCPFIWKLRSVTGH